MTKLCGDPYNKLMDKFLLKIDIKRASALMRYVPGSPNTNIVKKIKYKDGQTLAVYMGRMMAETHAPFGFFNGIDLIIPVPLTRKRRNHRGYNQTELLAKGVSEITNIPIDNVSVVRRQWKVSQTQLNVMQRSENVKDAFDCVKPENLNGKHILLIDDVVTTGSTLLSLADSIVAKTSDVKFSILTLAITAEIA